jgi:hypothetical protein
MAASDRRRLSHPGALGGLHSSGASWVLRPGEHGSRPLSSISTILSRERTNVDTVMVDAFLKTSRLRGEDTRARAKPPRRRGRHPGLTPMSPGGGECRVARCAMPVVAGAAPLRRAACIARPSSPPPNHRPRPPAAVRCHTDPINAVVEPGWHQQRPPSWRRAPPSAAAPHPSRARRCNQKQ